MKVILKERHRIRTGGKSEECGLENSGLSSIFMSWVDFPEPIPEITYVVGNVRANLTNS